MSDQIAAASLTVPAAHDHIPFARLLTSGMADRVGFDYEAIEDLRTAVHELCKHLIDHVDAGEDVHLRLVARTDELELTAVAERLPGRPPLPMDPLAQAIVAAVADEVELDTSGPVVSFRLLKRVGRSS